MARFTPMKEFKGSDQNLADTQPVRVSVKDPIKSWVVWALFSGGAILIISMLGALRGYQDGMNAYKKWEASEITQRIQEQYQLGVQDFEAGRFDLARQRFEYVMAHAPGYPGVADKLVEVIQILSATATFTPLPPTPSTTPTRDLRPVEELFSQAQSYFDNSDWNGVLETLVALRKEDIFYRVVEVDRLIFLSLRNRGINKIQLESNLEGGMYDLALAERFGPLDAEAVTYRNLARLYVIGSSFWEVHPEQAVYYFGQVASAAPYLRDASGWTARERYRAVLLQYGDQLVRNGDWCNAQTQYALATSIRTDLTIEVTATYVGVQCSPPTATMVSPTGTLTPTNTATYTFTPSATFLIIPSVTASPMVTPTISTTLTPTITLTNTPIPPIPSDTPTPELPTPPHTPTATPVPEPLPTPSETVSPQPSNTPTETIPPDASATSTPSPTNTKISDSLFHNWTFYSIRFFNWLSE